MAEPLLETEARSAVSAEHAPRLARLVQEQFAFVWRLLRRIGVPESDADDATEQVFIAASRRIGDIRAGSERSFLFSTALHIGSRARRSRVHQREDLGVELGDDVSNDVALAPPPDELVDRRRARALLDELLAEMPLELEVIFVLYEIEQLTTMEIAAVVGVPTGTVASRLRRAREDFAARVARIEARRKSGGKSDD